MEGIKNIIFDLGGVLLNIDYSKPLHAFQKLGINVNEQFYSQSRQSEVFDLLEIGKISEMDFVSFIQEKSEMKISYQDVIDAWNSILLDFPIRRLQILQQLQLHYNLYLLSNTNEIHEKAFNQILFQTCGYPTLAVFFDKIYLSHRIGLRKPDPAIFELVIKENRLNKNETLFIDDSYQHIESAEKIGLKTIHLSKGMTIEKDIFRPKKNTI